MFPRNRSIIAILTLLSFIHKSSGISCFDCNSANNSACLDIHEIDPEMQGLIVPVVNCNRAIPAPVAENFFCRKIVQTIYFPHRTNEIRVTRDCGWTPDTQECYSHRTHDHSEVVCQCFTDLCNSADSTDPASGTVLFLFLAACLYFYR